MILSLVNRGFWLDETATSQRLTDLAQDLRALGDVRQLGETIKGVNRESRRSQTVRGSARNLFEKKYERGGIVSKIITRIEQNARKPKS